MELLIHIWLYYGTFTVLLMLFFIILLGVHTKFKTSSFYRIVQCDMALNLGCYFNSWIFRLAIRPDTGYLLENIYYNNHWIFEIVAFSDQFFFQTQSVSIIILCFYRYSLIRFENANRFWAKWYFLVYLGVCLYAIGINLPVAYCLRPLFYNETLKYFINWKDSPMDELMIFATHLFLCTFIYFISIVTLGILTLKKLRVRFTHHQDDQRTKEMMKRMTIIVAINSIVYLMIIIWEFAITLFFPSMSEDIKVNMMMCVSDMLSFSMAYTLLICDKNVQEVFFGQLNQFKFKIGTKTSSILFVRKR